MGDLIRYGLQWNGPDQFVCTEMPDGYWTPWHVAQARITALETALRDCVRHMKTAGDPEAVRACEAAEELLEVSDG